MTWFGWLFCSSVAILYDYVTFFYKPRRPKQYTYRYDNIWYRGDVQASSLDDAVVKFNELFQANKIALRCNPDQLEKVDVED